MVTKLLDQLDPTPEEMHIELFNSEAEFYGSLNNDMLVLASQLEGFLNVQRISIEEDIMDQDLPIVKALEPIAAKHMTIQMMNKKRTTMFINRG